MSKCSSSVGNVPRAMLFRELPAPILFSVSFRGSIFWDKRRLSYWTCLTDWSKFDLAMLDLVSTSEERHSLLSALYDVMIAVCTTLLFEDPL